MTQDFLDGMLVTLIPSMLAVAWLIWRADAGDADESERRSP
jgi:hypothetical protein